MLLNKWKKTERIRLVNPGSTYHRRGDSELRDSCCCARESRTGIDAFKQHAAALGAASPRSVPPRRAAGRARRRLAARRGTPPASASRTVTTTTTARTPRTTATTPRTRKRCARRARTLAAPPAPATQGCARACSQDEPPCGACLAAGCMQCGLADAHEEEEEAQAHKVLTEYELFGTDDEEGSGDEAVEELESTLQPPKPGGLKYALRGEKVPARARRVVLPRRAHGPGARQAGLALPEGRDAWPVRLEPLRAF